MKKQVILTKHAAERALERRISLKEIEKMLAEGIRLKDEDNDTILCIYKAKHTYYTLVIDEKPEQVTIITGYESSELQVLQYEKVKQDA